MRNDWICADDRNLLAQCSVTCCRPSGNGGQKVNKTSSTVLVSHLPSGLSARSGASRSQSENKKHALRSLREEMALELRCEPDQELMFEPKFSCSNPKSLVWIACVLDIWSFFGWDPKKTAEFLNVSVSRLLKICSKYPKMWRKIAEMRKSLELQSLRKIE